MKKIILLVLVLTTLVGCGGSGTSDSSEVVNKASVVTLPSTNVADLEKRIAQLEATIIEMKALEEGWRFTEEWRVFIRKNATDIASIIGARSNEKVQGLIDKEMGDYAAQQSKMYQQACRREQATVNYDMNCGAL